MESSLLAFLYNSRAFHLRFSPKGTERRRRRGRSLQKRNDCGDLFATVFSPSRNRKPRGGKNREERNFHLSSEKKLKREKKEDIIVGRRRRCRSHYYVEARKESHSHRCRPRPPSPSPPCWAHSYRRVMKSCVVVVIGDGGGGSGGGSGDCRRRRCRGPFARRLRRSRRRMWRQRL